ncbi:hypothetical protein H6F44_10930 [Pseudanabaena sp. FACHB-1277]|uniref:Uncharacterized protein n=1 Tax=Pseudanabaena cinerea FACHB-1277 TaxID=2949581 RepID=A0A926UT57_9CYAN|nr:hypothetical protein [Pseudanabaena cinerea]MBD2150629.1 hypothetical protein [Pseudanabaena cinerea FACHB-1277]
MHFSLANPLSITPTPFSGIAAYEKIAEKLQNYTNLQIGDFGCGEAKLAELLPNHL